MGSKPMFLTDVARMLSMLEKMVRLQEQILEELVKLNKKKDKGKCNCE